MSPFNSRPQGFSAAALELLDQGLNQIWSEMQSAADAKRMRGTEPGSDGAPVMSAAAIGVDGEPPSLAPVAAIGNEAPARRASAGRAGRAAKAKGQSYDALNSHNRSEWMSQQTQHKYKVGQEVSFSPAKLSMPASSRAYKITSRLPREGGEYMYRIKSAAELFERVARESEIVRLSAAGGKGA